MLDKKEIDIFEKVNLATKEARFKFLEYAEEIKDSETVVKSLLKIDDVLIGDMPASEAFKACIYLMAKEISELKEEVKRLKRNDPQ